VVTFTVDGAVGTDVTIMAVRASEAASSYTSSGEASTVRAGTVRAGCGIQVAVLVVLRTGGVATITDVTEAASCAASDVLGDTLEFVIALLTTAKDASLALELVHGHGW